MKSVLVIEDEAVVRDLIIEILEVKGFETIAAEDGLAGVKLAKQHLPDLILCDVLMPKLDGYAVLESLREDPTTAMIPFIFLTGKAEREDMRRGMDLGADDYLTKPFTAEMLMAAVNTRLERQEMLARQSEKKLEHLRENIVYALPHELLTPLTGVLGFSKLLTTEYATLERSKIGEMVKDIHQSATRLHRLIQNFLVYAQIEVMSADPERVKAIRECVTFNPSAIIKEVSLNRASKSGREADLTLDLVDGPVQISERNLKKLVEEVADNAFKFSQPGTAVRLATAASEDTFTLQVTDHGRGMTPDQITSIGAYMQFGRKLYEQQGSGLGLVIAKRLAELHAGRLSIESVPNELTMVSVILKPGPPLKSDNGLP